MEKMRLETPDLTESNIEKIGFLFPECITETRDENGVLTKAIDFAKLRQRLSKDIVEGGESYEFSWVGKKAAMLESTKSIRKTLRPCKEESKNWDTTENLYIEGDNLDVLKMLRESYLNSIKMIYIDPPYNTGNDFIYNDDFKVSGKDYQDQSGEMDEEGNRLFKNTDSNGRFHSDWCSMIYSRLLLARNLLNEEGSIFISIDDNEQENLKKICDDVFGNNNFIGLIVWKRKRGRDNSAKYFSKSHEYLLVYAKNKACFNVNYLPLDENTRKAYKNPDNDPRGDYRMLGCWARGTQGGVKYEFKSKTGQIFSERLWLMGKEKLTKLDEEDKLIFRGDNIYRKMFIFENKGRIPETLWENVSNAANASDEIKMLFEKKIIFDTPKPIPYITEMLQIATNKNDIVLDFFSGSATTAHAVMQLNAEDGGQRKFIMVQVPERCPEKSAAYKAGYKNICEIGKERIRRAGDKIKADYADKKDIEKLDVGFRVFKSDSSNMKDIYYTPGEYSQDLLSYMESNIKEDRSDMDLLFSCLLEWGIPLSYEHITETIGGKTVHIYNHGDLIACFEENIGEDVVKEIARKKPLRVVFRDDGFGNSQDKINVEEIFKLLSPDTSLRVL